MIETHKIQPVFGEHFQLILDFPEPKDLIKILDPSYKYVWGIEHNEGRSSWLEYQHTLFGILALGETCLARQIKMEFLIETATFIGLLPNIKQTIKIVQTNIVPPPYLNLESFKGAKRYDMLKKEVDYLFELEMPGATDYTSIISPNRVLLEKVVAAFAS